MNKQQRREYKEAQRYWKSNGNVTKISKKDFYFKLILVVIFLIEILEIAFKIYSISSQEKMKADLYYKGNLLGYVFLQNPSGYFSSDTYKITQILLSVANVSWLAWIGYRWIFNNKQISIVYLVVPQLFSFLYVVTALPGLHERFDELRTHGESIAGNLVSYDQTHWVLNTSAFLYFNAFWFNLAFIVAEALGVSIFTILFLMSNSSDKLILR